MSPETRDFTKLEKAGWSEPATARSYAEDFAKASAYAVPVLVRQVKAGPGCTVLDLCCGHGLVTDALVKTGATVTALDFSPAMLELARAFVPQARFVEGDAMALPFDAASFDAVTIGFGIPHVPDPPRAFREARRCLRPGGRLAYSVWADEDGGMKMLFAAIADFGSPGIALPPGPGAHDYADPRRAGDALEQAGFVEIAMRNVDSCWQVDDPGMIFDFFDQGTVRGGALLRGQPASARAAIRESVAARIRAACGDGPVWTVPIPSVVVSAVAA